MVAAAAAATVAAAASVVHIYKQKMYILYSWLGMSYDSCIFNVFFPFFPLDSLYVSFNDYITTWIIYGFAVCIWIESAFSNVLQNISTQLLS